MKRTSLLAAALVCLTPAPALAAPDRTLEVTAGATKTYNGTPATGLNINYFNQLGSSTYAAPGTCTKDVQTYCDTTLLAFSNPVPDDDADGRLTKRVTVTLGEYGPVPDPATDFDLLAFKSDAAGVRGTELARDGDLTETGAETVVFTLTTTREQPVAYALLDVVYFATVASGFKATVRG